MPRIIHFKESVDLTDFTLIIPSVSVGNVPQLTVDLLITTYSLKKVATIWHPAIVPCVGNDPFSNGSEVCTACELYCNPDLKLATIQFRSSLEFRLALKFFQDIRDTFIKLNFKNVIILSSIFDYEQHKVTGDKFYYIGEDNKDIDLKNIRQLQKDSSGNYCLNGAGFAIKLYEILQTSLKSLIIGKYISEGDNRPDAHSMLMKLLPLVGIKEVKSQIVHPDSWQFVFGGPPPIGIF